MITEALKAAEILNNWLMKSESLPQDYCNKIKLANRSHKLKHKNSQAENNDGFKKKLI
jgi:hypothetical protein